MSRIDSFTPGESTLAGSSFLDLAFQVRRQTAIYQAIGEPREWRRQVAIHTMLTKLDAPDRLPHYLSDLLVICRGGQRAAVAACMPMAALPRPLYALVRRVVRRSRGMSMEDPSFDEFRL